MAPIIPSIAIPIITFVIFAFPPFASPDDHCTPHTTIMINDTRRMTVTSILVATLTSVGNALSALSSPASPLDLSTQRPTNGRLVLSGIPTLFPSPFFQYLQLHGLSESARSVASYHLSATHLFQLHARASALPTKSDSQE